jgi:RNA-splicing ligase RtcB
MMLLLLVQSKSREGQRYFASTHWAESHAGLEQMIVESAELLVLVLSLKLFSRR